MRQSFPSAALRSPPPPPLPSLVSLRRRDPEDPSSEYYVCTLSRTRGKKRRGGDAVERIRMERKEEKRWGDRDEGPRRAFISNCNARSRNAWDPRRCLDTTVPVRVFLVTRFPDQPHRGISRSPLQTRIPFLGRSILLGGEYQCGRV